MANITYNLLSTYVVASNGTINTITFNSFTGYKDILFKCSFRQNDSSVAFTETYLTVNSVSGYNRQYLTSNGVANSSGADTNLTKETNAYSNSTGSNTYSFSQYDIYMSDISNSSYLKAFSSDGAALNPASGGNFAVIYAGGTTSSTAAITSVNFSSPTGFFFVAGSSVSAYGIKNT
jgi:hypothetical protein